MALPVGKIAAGALVVVVSFAGAFVAMNVLSPSARRAGRRSPTCRRSSRSPAAR